MDIRQILIVHNQQHLLPVYDGLTGERRRSFERQISDIHWRMIESGDTALENKSDIRPIRGLSLSEIRRDNAAFQGVGIDTLRAGKVGAVLLAGGQGTRLGFDGPKGCYDIGISRHMTVFERLFANLTGVCKRVGCWVALFIMTCSGNDSATREFLQKNNYFGYPEQYVKFFVQHDAPVTDLQGRLIYDGNGGVVCSPDGNGGWFDSLKESGQLDLFPEIEWLNVFAVDNVLQRIADPLFVGATVLSGRDCGAKFVRKRYPEEKVGVLCLENGAPSVIEYYELTAQMANERDAEGNLVYGFGVILNYLFKADRLRRISAARLPVHRVKKTMNLSVGTEGKPVPKEVYKYETLILDAVRLSGSCLPFEVVREREFAPIKNATGPDSVQSARELLKFNNIEL